MLDEKNFLKEFRINIVNNRRLDFSTSKSPREVILISELKDFKTLYSELDDCVDKLEDITEDIVDRFKIEIRNTFSIEVKENYKSFLIATRLLKNVLLNKQKTFYEERISELESELEALKEN